MRRELCPIASDYPDDYGAVFRTPSALARPLASSAHTGHYALVDGDLGHAELTYLDLDDDERYILSRGIVEWGGPAYPTEELAVAMGFSSVQELLLDGKRLHDAVKAGHPLSSTDWFRVVLATEIAFASDLVGSGRDWSITTGVSDEQSLRTLRGIQRKLTQEIRRVSGSGVGTLPSG